MPYTNSKISFMIVEIILDDIKLVKYTFLKLILFFVKIIINKNILINLLKYFKSNIITIDCF